MSHLPPSVSVPLKENSQKFQSRRSKYRNILHGRRFEIEGEDFVIMSLTFSTKQEWMNIIYGLLLFIREWGIFRENKVYREKVRLVEDCDSLPDLLRN